MKFICFVAHMDDVWELFFVNHSTECFFHIYFLSQRVWVTDVTNMHNNILKKRKHVHPKPFCSWHAYKLW